jgi:hypothetical protein
MPDNVDATASRHVVKAAVLAPQKRPAIDHRTPCSARVTILKLAGGGACIIFFVNPKGAKMNKTFV